MGINHRFDELAKAVGRGLVSRREIFWRLGGALAAAVLGAVGLVRADDVGCIARGCATCCHKLFPAHGAEHGECMRACLQGVLVPGNCACLVRLGCEGSLPAACVPPAPTH